MRRPSSSTVLVVVATIAASLRFWRLYWGLAEGRWFFDEGVVWLPRLMPFRTLSGASFDVTYFGYPTLYGYVGGLAAWLVSWLDAPVFGAAGLIACLRTVAALASVLTVLVVARLGGAMYGPWTGVAAAGFLAVAPLDAMQTHYASVEPLLNLLATLALAGGWRIVERGRTRDALCAGVAVGLATATKYTALAFVIPVAWAAGERAWRVRSWRAVLLLGAAAVLALPIAFVVGCPPCALGSASVLSVMETTGRRMAVGIVENNCVSPSVGWWGRRWLHQVVAVLPYGLGAPIALLALAGVVVAVRRRTPADRLLLAAVVPYYAYMGSFVTAYPRYMLPIFPALALLAAAGLARLARPGVAALVATLVMAYGVALSGSQVARFSWDQQTAVADWLGARAKLVPPADHRVGITSNMEIDPYYRLREHIAPRGYAVIVQHPGHWLEGRPGFFVLPEWQSIAIRRDRRDPALIAALDALEGGRSGYQPVLRIPIPPYLQRPLDERLDPAFAVDLWQGAIGFTIYARDDLAPRLKALEPPASAGAPAPPRADGAP